MGRKGWIILLAAIGIGAAIVIGALANSQTRAERQLCNSLESLESSVEALENTDPSTLTQGSLQSDLQNIDSAWDDVKSDAKNVADFEIDDLQDAWNSFTGAVNSIPSDATPSEAASDIASAAQSLKSSVDDSIDGLDCS